jgi:hypothetical protein
MALVTQSYDLRNCVFNGSWGGTNPGIEVQVQTVPSSLGKLLFTKYFATTTGLTAHNFIEGVEYKYGKRMDASTTQDPGDGFGTTAGGIVDTGISGALAAPIRIIENSKNIKDVTGLNLKVYAKNLTQIESPPKDRIYVDPYNKTAIFPRPSLMLKFKSDGGMLSPEIYDKIEPIYELSPDNFVSSVTGKFDYGMRVSTSINKYGGLSIYPFDSFPANITASFWCYMSHTSNIILIGTEDGIFQIGLASGTNASFIKFNRTIIATGTVDVSSISASHIYLEYSYSGGLNGSKYVRVFSNNTEVISTTTAIPSACLDGTFRVFIGKQSSHTAITHTTIDNLKIWKEIVYDAASDVAAWEYNSGTGNELGLHRIYGASHNYQPYNLQNGYYHIVPFLFASCPKPGTNTEITLEDPSYNDTLKVQGLFGSSSAMRKSDYTQLMSGTDYQYGKRLDASTSEDATYGFGAVAGGIFDTGTSGSHASGKYFRIVNNALNIKAGLSAKVFAENFYTIDITKIPKADRYNVDPARGRFIGPHAFFWSKCESPTGFLSPEIGYYTPTITESGAFSSWSYDAGKFGQALYQAGDTGGGSVDGSHSLNYTGGTAIDMSYGTVSAWIKVLGDSGNVAGYSNGQAQAWAYPIIIDSVLSVYWYMYHINASLSACYVELVVNGSSAGTVTVSLSAFHHIYAVWSKDNDLGSSKSVKVYIDGTEQLSSTATLNNATSKSPYGYLRTYSLTNGIGAQWGTAHIWFDNVKVFNHAIDDPAWEYNSGSGREDAIHPIYGSGANYKPLHTSTNSGGVGYFKAGGTGVYSSLKV